MCNICFFSGTISYHIFHICFSSRGLAYQNHLITNGLGEFRKYFCYSDIIRKPKNAATEQIEFIDRLHSFLKLYRMANGALWRIFSTNRKRESTFRPALIHVTTLCMAYILKQQCHMDLVIKFESAMMTFASHCLVIYKLCSIRDLEHCEQLKIYH